MGEIRSKMVDIDYDEIWYRYKNEAETFNCLYEIYKEEGDAEIALYKWIFYLTYGNKWNNYNTCNDGTFEEAVRRIYEAVYNRHRIFLKTKTVDSLQYYSGYSDANSLVNAINSGKQKWEQKEDLLYIKNSRDNNEVIDDGSYDSEYLKVVNKVKELEKTAKNINDKLDNMEIEWDYFTKGNTIEIQAV